MQHVAGNMLPERVRRAHSAQSLRWLCAENPQTT